MVQRNLDSLSLNSSAKYQEKHSIIEVQATPKIQPGGVQGALFKLKYQSDVGPLSINQLPRAKPPKLIAKKRMK